MAKKRKERRVASLTIKSPGKLIAAERRDIAAWLRKQADKIAKGTADYTDGRFTAGFNYVG